MGKKSCEALYELLKAHYSTVGITIVNNASDLEALAAKRPDLVFAGMKYVAGDLPGTLIWVSSFLEEHGISHTGSAKNAIELERNKALAKHRITHAGLKTSAYVVVENGAVYSQEDAQLRFPLFIKPTSLGGGQGIDEHSIVHNTTELQSKITALSAEYATGILAEEYLPGREFSVALLKHEYSEELIVMPVELTGENNVPEGRILSMKEKSSNKSRLLPVVDSSVRTAVCELAEQAFIALGARDYGRIDIRLDSAGVPHFLEANLIPSLIDGYGSFPQACSLNLDMNYEEMILHIVQLGFTHDTACDDPETLPILGTQFIPAPAM